MKVPVQRIREISQDCIRIHGNVKKNKCDSICNEILHRLENEPAVDEDLPNAIRAPVNGSNHFIAPIPLELTSNSRNEGYLLVDPTIQQFAEDESDFPDVAFLFPGDSRREEWYDYIQIPP